jgi:hypothetical protein
MSLLKRIENAPPAPPPHYHSRVDRPPVVEQVTMTVVQFGRGMGCCEQSPYRIVTAYYFPDGSLLTEVDHTSGADHV